MFKINSKEVKINDCLIVSDNVVIDLKDFPDSSSEVKHNVFYNASFSRPSKFHKILMKLKLVPKSIYVLEENND